MQQPLYFISRKYAQILDLRGKLGALLLAVLERERREVQRSRNLRVDIAPNQSAERHENHDPVGHAGYAAELERRVKGDEEWRDQSEQDVKVQPMPGTALPPKPGPTQTNRIEVQQ